MTAQSSPTPKSGSDPHLVEDQSEILAFLARPAAYGLASGPVERIDTHGASVFLAGERAYKLKRAVRFPYMDYSTLEKRRVACETEIALNRRTAPDLYLGVEPLAREADGALRIGGDGDVVEWLVVMRRFDQDGLFDRLAESGRLSADLVSRLADRIAAFHQAAEPLSADSAPGGGSAGLRAVIEENFAELAERPDLFPPEECQALERDARAALSRHADLLDRRLAEGYVRRCHGDLHLRNICLYDGEPTIFDAIEFNDAIAC
ncbi:MAG TPA: phosphotransferase, partial [Kiloniellales bacterium]|nr:phosphotransferase [Kiloniellales bacterium]